MGTVKISVVAKGWVQEVKGRIGGELRIFRSSKLF
jgi:hypothetical protein